MSQHACYHINVVVFEFGNIQVEYTTSILLLNVLIISVIDPDLGAGCSSLPAKCVASNKASCTPNNCKDQCNVNCCNGAASKKCTIPTCKSCKDATAIATCNANRVNQCKLDSD